MRFPIEAKTDLRSGKFTAKQIVNKYPELTIKQVCDFAYHYGIKYPKHKNFDESFFMRQTPNMAYMLGWLAADGNVSDRNEIKILLKATDIVMLRNLASMINLTNKISESSYFDQRTQKVYHKASFCFTSEVVVTELAKYGIVPRKSLILSYPQCLESDDIRRHFIRGYLDGDGCIQRMGNRDSSVSFVGSPVFVEELQRDINRMLQWQVKGTVQHRHNCSTLKYGGNRSALHLLSWLYADTTPQTRLERKYIMYLDLLSMFSKRKKAVLRTSLSDDDDEDVEYESVERAIEENGLKKNTLLCCLRGQNASCGGYKWKYIA